MTDFSKDVHVGVVCQRYFWSVACSWVYLFTVSYSITFCRGSHAIQTTIKPQALTTAKKIMFEIRYSKSFDSASYYNVASSSLPSAGA